MRASLQLKDSDYSLQDRRETAACVVTGYAIIYFLHSYFLWLNAMALNSWLAFKPSCWLAKLSERMKAESTVRHWAEHRSALRHERQLFSYKNFEHSLSCEAS